MAAASEWGWFEFGRTAFGSASEAAKWESAELDSAPKPAAQSTTEERGRSASYGTTLEHPAGTRSVETIIPPIASREPVSFSYYLDALRPHKVTRYFPMRYRLGLRAEIPLFGPNLPLRLGLRPNPSNLGT